jgi:hypothetical protein
MQREGKPSPAYPNPGPALLLAGLFLWSLLDDSEDLGSIAASMTDRAAAARVRALLRKRSLHCPY